MRYNSTPLTSAKKNTHKTYSCITIVAVLQCHVASAPKFPSVDLTVAQIKSVQVVLFQLLTRRIYTVTGTIIAIRVES